MAAVQNQYGENQVKWETRVLKEKRRCDLLGTEKIRRWWVTLKWLESCQGIRRGHWQGKHMNQQRLRTLINRPTDLTEKIRTVPIICRYHYLQSQLNYYYSVDLCLIFKHCAKSFLSSFCSFFLVKKRNNWAYQYLFLNTTTLMKIWLQLIASMELRVS